MHRVVFVIFVVRLRPSTKITLAERSAKYGGAERGGFYVFGGGAGCGGIDRMAKREYAMRKDHPALKHRLARAEREVVR
jgi:hypothetical protein